LNKGIIELPFLVNCGHGHYFCVLAAGQKLAEEIGFQKSLAHTCTQGIFAYSSVEIHLAVIVLSSNDANTSQLQLYCTPANALSLESFFDNRKTSPCCLFMSEGSCGQNSHHFAIFNQT
jgi:hypothetical protein